MASVLIVDDEQDLAALVEFNLQQAGFETHIALTAAQALELARQRVPDVVLLDLMLPDISGKEATENAIDGARGLGNELGRNLGRCLIHRC